LKITIFNGKIHYKWSFSIATLNYQRVEMNNILQHHPTSAFFLWHPSGFFFWIGAILAQLISQAVNFKGLPSIHSPPGQFTSEFS